ncbi:unnamed protein product [Enterobius vermicularis]|uniref:Nucleoporin NUP35 n=1 Tax=Enterobius vermicularis TaxID=51028 RepID=A0A0N4UZH6_ENTVE|nr:unnamed protein product [Enterobius vermicularis]
MINPDIERRASVGRRNSLLLNSTPDSNQVTALNGHVSSPSTPNFLFGAQNKRRSLALPSGHNYAGVVKFSLGSSLRNQRDEGMNFASPLPSYITPLETSSKTVHWSPALVSSEKSPSKTRDLVSSEAPAKLGPPLRSIREELDQMRTAPVNSALVEPMDSTSAMDTSPAEEDESANWVMVYGFAPGDAAEVLKIFSRHGTVVAKKFPEEGNWVYLRYACPIHAQQALSRNAHVFNGRMRLGVLPVRTEEIAAFTNCSSRDVSLRTDRENLNVSRARALHTSLLAASSPLGSSNRGSPLDVSYRPSRLSNASRAGIRSLNASYNVADNEYRVDSVQQPVKNVGLMSKLWGYIS